MIEHLRIGYAGNFYYLRQALSNAAINGLFVSLRSLKKTKSNDVFRIIRDTYLDTVYSAVCFPYERSPLFLDTKKYTETIYCFVLIVEKDDMVAVFKSGIDIPSSFRSLHFRAIDSEKVERAIARHGVTFEKISLKHMSLSKHTVRQKILEAADLEHLVASVSANRFIPQRYSVKGIDGSYSATPSTGRISFQSDRETYKMAIEWSSQIITSIKDNTNKSSDFIRGFARPYSLDKIKNTTNPTFLAINTPNLTGLLLGENREIRLVKKTQDDLEELSKDEVETIIVGLADPMPLADGGRAIDILDSKKKEKCGTLLVGKKRISLSRFDLPIATNIYVESSDLELGSDQERRPLLKYINFSSLFTVIFDDMSLAYIDGQLYRDETMLGGGERLLRHLKTSDHLDYATSEKGDFAVGQIKFSEKSVFRIVVDHISDGDVVVCDDLGDEWADFISINTETIPVSVNFYHAKHGDKSTSASAFHESVGQAIKNLGRMSLPSASMPKKIASWSKLYNGEKTATSINRIIRGGGVHVLSQKIELARTSPDVVGRVYIVTSSLSKSEVKGILEDAKNGKPPTAHFVQLYWLLTSFFGACAELGVVGYIVCRP